MRPAVPSPPTAGERTEGKTLEAVLPPHMFSEWVEERRREQDRPGPDRARIQLWAHPSCPLPSPEVQEIQTSLFGLWRSPLLLWQLGGLSGGRKKAAAAWKSALEAAALPFCCGGIGISEQWGDIPSAISGGHREGGFRAATPVSS